MRLIIGGAHEGKSGYAAEKYGKYTDAFHMRVKEWLDDGKDPLEMTRRFLEENPDAVIVMDEMGCGIVPLEKSERIWLKSVGEVGCFLASRAESVERICCGIGVKIK